MSTLASRQYNFVDDKNSGIPITSLRIDAEFDNDITKLNQKCLIAASAPSEPLEGEVWYDSTNKLLMVYRNSAWAQVNDFDTLVFYDDDTISYEDALVTYS